ncbi:acyl-CoA carboxylase subunit epsilon [Wenjunlia tyrosinilytica]|uniref:Acyl-CoA carboxylase epsilon subunit-like protein n=1 Tax=Wenjunlia tyrosinilytica TaxID=1544741 RepID=A0A917ZRE3_9ACTN|nr:hypothetical protein GCM10012280_33840 [Wenjunlia tyrosinilytica]
MKGGGAQRGDSGLRVVRGSPTDEELAALVVAVTALACAAVAARAGARPKPGARRWNARRHQMTQQPTGSGPGAWLMSVWR